MCVIKFCLSNILENLDIFVNIEVLLNYPGYKYYIHMVLPEALPINGASSALETESLGQTTTEPFPSCVTLGNGAHVRTPPFSYMQDGGHYSNLR